MPARARWDIFCQVVDNFGDIGVCWRLARQLANEYGLRVRLWVDDLASFASLAPALDRQASRQSLHGVEIRAWETPFADTAPAEVVIEAFACNLPENYIAAMAAQTVKPLWINLEYLSAEAWVAEYHARPSPHPRLPLTKYFFFPGFTEASGGLIREAGLFAARDAFQADPEAQAAWWRQIGVAPTPSALKISLFAYPHAPVAALLEAWQHGATPIDCLLPETPFARQVATELGLDRLAPGASWRRGRLTVCGLPFLPQDDYDRLLRACDLNFVRGEDSFVRAQWAAQPFIWQIYPQIDAAHREKLAAFLALYRTSAGTGPETEALITLWQAWNGFGDDPAQAWPAFAAALPALRRSARNWAEHLGRQTDLAARLVKFSETSL